MFQSTFGSDKDKWTQGDNTQSRNCQHSLIRVLGAEPHPSHLTCREVSGGVVGLDLGGEGYGLIACTGALRPFCHLLLPMTSPPPPSAYTPAYMTLHNRARKKQIQSDVVQPDMVSMM